MLMHSHMYIAMYICACTMHATYSVAIVRTYSMYAYSIPKRNCAINTNIPY